MTPLAWFGVAAAGAVGAPLRYVVDRAVQDRTRGAFPWGTFTVNAAGSLVLGLVAGLVLHHDAPETWATVVGVGFCGAFTTFSTFSYETIRLLEEGALDQALRNVFGTLAVAVSAAATGLVVAAVL